MHNTSNTIGKVIKGSIWQEQRDSFLSPGMHYWIVRWEERRSYSHVTRKSRKEYFDTLDSMRTFVAELYLREEP